MARAGLFDLWLWPFEAATTMMRFSETIWGSQAVIGARLPIIAKAAADPLRADHRELSRMVTEKTAAFGRSGRALSSGQQSIRSAFHANARDLGRLSGGGVLTPLDWWQAMMRNIDLAATLTSLPGEMLHPVHTTVRRNTRRLRA